MVSYKSLISACETSQQWEQALSLLPEMGSSRLEPTERPGGLRGDHERTTTLRGPSAAAAFSPSEGANFTTQLGPKPNRLRGLGEDLTACVFHLKRGWQPESR